MKTISSKWYKNIPSPISIKDINNTFKGYYKKYPLNDNEYVELPDFIKSEDEFQYSLVTFEEEGDYLIKIQKLEDEEIQYLQIKVSTNYDQSILNDINTNITDLKTLTSFKIDDLKNTIQSDEIGLVKIINDISNLPNGTRLDTLLNKMDQLQLAVTNLKTKTIAFINNG